MRCHLDLFRPVATAKASELKHGAMKIIFLHLKSEYLLSQEMHLTAIKLIAYQAVQMSNDLYESETLSAFAMVRDFTNPVQANAFSNATTNELIHAQEKLKDKRKLNNIFRSKEGSDPPITVGDMVEIYTRRGHEKRGK